MKKGKELSNIKKCLLQLYIQLPFVLGLALSTFFEEGVHILWVILFGLGVIAVLSVVVGVIIETLFWFKEKYWRVEPEFIFVDFFGFGEKSSKETFQFFLIASGFYLIGLIILGWYFLSDTPWYNLGI